MAVHNEEEELLEIRILLLISHDDETEKQEKYPEYQEREMYAFANIIL